MNKKHNSIRDFNRNFILILLFALSFTVTGCGMSGKTTLTRTIHNVDGTYVTEVTENPTDTIIYQQSVAMHSESESRRISSQAGSIAASSKCDSCSPDAAAIIIFASMQQIAMLNPTPYAGKAPTTGWDVANTVAKEAKGIVGVGGMTYVGAKGVDAIGNLVKNAGDNTTLNFGDNNNIEGFNKEVVNQEMHATAVGADSVPTINTENPEQDEEFPPIPPELPEY